MPSLFNMIMQNTPPSFTYTFTQWLTVLLRDPENWEKYAVFLEKYEGNPPLGAIWYEFFHQLRPNVPIIPFDFMRVNNYEHFDDFIAVIANAQIGPYGILVNDIFAAHDMRLCPMTHTPAPTLYTPA